MAPGELDQRVERLAAFVRGASGCVRVEIGSAQLRADLEDAARLRLDAVFEGGDWGADQTTRATLLLEFADATREGTESDRLALLEAVRLAGVAAPEPLWACEDAAVLGREFHLLGGVAGAPAARLEPPVLRELGAALARLHSIRPPWPGLEFLHEPGLDVARHRIDELRLRLDAFAAPHPALEWALRWLERRAPREPELVLGHGALGADVCVVERGALVALEHWSAARWAHPLEDLARLSVCLAVAHGEAEAERLVAIVGAGYAVVAGGDLDTRGLAYWEALACAEIALGAGRGDAPRASAEREAWARVEALRAAGAAASRDRLVDARVSVVNEIQSPGAAGDGARACAAARELEHLAELYGHDTGAGDDAEAALRRGRFARDVRDGVFDGACARAARAVITEHLRATDDATDDAMQGVKRDVRPEVGQEVGPGAT